VKSAAKRGAGSLGSMDTEKACSSPFSWSASPRSIPRSGIVPYKFAKFSDLESTTCGEGEGYQKWSFYKPRSNSQVVELFVTMVREKFVDEVQVIGRVHTIRQVRLLSRFGDLHPPLILPQGTLQNGAFQLLVCLHTTFMKAIFWDERDMF